MDIDLFLKSATEEEMELMMDFFPDFGDSNIINHTSTAHALPPHHHHNHMMMTSSSAPPSSSNSMAAMREVIFRIAAMQPIHIDPESVKAPKRRNVKISKDPQSVAARHRRERISERIRILQRLVPGGTKMDTASMLDEAIHYVKFLKSQVQTLEMAAATGSGFPVTVSKGTYMPMPMPMPYQQQQQISPNFHHFGSSN